MLQRENAQQSDLFWLRKPLQSKHKNGWWRRNVYKHIKKRFKAKELKIHE